jgi:hypothetical protein
MSPLLWGLGVILLPRSSKIRPISSDFRREFVGPLLLELRLDRIEQLPVQNGSLSALADRARGRSLSPNDARTEERARCRRRLAFALRCPMQQQNDHFREQHFAAIRTKLGEGLREQHDLMEPLAPRLVELLKQLEASGLDRDTAKAKLHAEMEESIAAMAHSAHRRPLNECAEIVEGRSLVMPPHERPWSHPAHDCVSARPSSGWTRTTQIASVRCPQMAGINGVGGHLALLQP